MSTAPFDTLEAVEILKEADVPEKQAKAFAIVVRKWHESAEVATKQDITELRHELKELELRLTGEMKLLRWILAVISGGIVTLILKAFF